MCLLVPQLAPLRAVPLEPQQLTLLQVSLLAPALAQMQALPPPAPVRAQVLVQELAQEYVLAPVLVPQQATL